MNKYLDSYRFNVYEQDIHEIQQLYRVKQTHITTVELPKHRNKHIT